LQWKADWESPHPALILFLIERSKNYEHPRYKVIVDDMQQVARANLIFGLHVHVGVEDAKLLFISWMLQDIFYLTFLHFPLILHFGLEEIPDLNPTEAKYLIVFQEREFLIFLTVFLSMINMLIF